jgi:HK97 family phage portal protein
MFNNIKNLFKKSVSDKYTLHKSVNLQGDSVLSTSQYLSLAEISLDVNKRINKRADKVGQIQFKLLKGDKEIEKHPILDLLDKPNSQMTGDIFWRLASYYHDTCGFALIRKIGNNAVFSENSKIKELQLLNPAGMTINYEGNEIKSFCVSDFVTGNKETVPFNECIYWVNPNPKKPTEGISLLRAGLYAIDLDNQLSQYHTAILKNGGTVDSVLTFENGLTKEQLENLKETYREEYATASKSGTPMFLGGGADYKKLGLTPNELSFLETKKVNAEDMVKITGVPDDILGLTSGETFANAEVAYRIFLRETIKPLIMDLINVLDWQLVPPEYELDFVDPTPDDVEIKLKTLETGSKVNAYTTNEKREILGLDPIKDGDEIVFVNRNQTPTQTEEKDFKPVLSHPLKNKAFRANYFKYHIKSLESKQNKLISQLDKYFKAQEKRVLANIDSKKLVMIKKNVNEIFDIDLETKLALPLLETIKEIAKESGQDVYDMFNLGANFMYSSTLETKLQNRFDFWSRKINETTANKLTNELADWTSNEETLSDLISRVKTTYDGITEARASTIALTETGIATQEARLDGYVQMGIPTKVWVWSPGIKGGIRDNHASLDGEEVPINGYFSNGMKHPLDPNFGADELCNCQCTL